MLNVRWSPENLFSPDSQRPVVIVQAPVAGPDPNTKLKSATGCTPVFACATGVVFLADG
jgi:hypothetical protein